MYDTSSPLRGVVDSTKDQTSGEAMSTGAPPKKQSVWLERVTDTDTLFRTFIHAIGAEQAQMAYGELKVRGSVYHAFSGAVVEPFAYAPLLAVGWGMLTPAPSDDAVWLTTGVYPWLQRQGWRNAIREALCDIAFSRRDVQVARIGVFFRNEKHVERCQREAALGGPWKNSGFISYPEGYGVFSRTREDWLMIHPSCLPGRHLCASKA